MAFQIQKVTKQQAKLRMALSGPSGSGKTYTALSLASHMGGKICVFDTEYHSAAKYASRFSFDGALIEGNYHPDRYVEAIHEAERAGYDIIVIDSLTHAWNGPGGVLELVSQETKRKYGNSYAAWDTVTPIYRNLIHTIMGSSAHIIVTLRAKQDYVQEKDSNGKTNIKKVGMAPEIREGFSYEMDIEGLLDIDHNFIVGKTRCDEIDGRVFTKPGKDLADILLRWLNEGDVAPEKPAPAPEPQKQTTSNDPWADADPWMLQAREQVVEGWGISLGSLQFIRDTGAPTAVQAMRMWAGGQPEGTDLLDAFLKAVRAAMPKEEAKAS